MSVNGKNDKVHVDDYEGMKLITHIGQTFLSDDSLKSFEFALAHGWKLDNNYVCGNKFYVVLTLEMPQDIEDSLYNEHAKLMEMMKADQAISEYPDGWQFAG
jgi:hypothetical protein